jgi:eukaryotic-like serine/threonine-protein kinase
MKRAIRALIRAVEIDPASHEAQEYLGGIEIETGLIDRGVPRAVYALGIQPPRPMPCMILARCYALLGRFEEAEPHLAESHRRSSIPTLGHLVYTLRLHAYRWGKRPFNLSISQRKAVREKDWVGVTYYVDALSETADPNVVSKWMDAFLPALTNPRAGMMLRQVCTELCMLVGLENKAYELLAECARMGLIDIFWVDRCPLLAPLRARDGFGEIRDWVWLNAYGVWH